MKEEDLSFVARHYRKGSFSTDTGWRRLGLINPFRWKRLRIAAAVAATIILSATATYIYNEYNIEPSSEPVQSVLTTPELIERTIDFEDAPLTAVIAEIKKVYGIEVDNLPDDPDTYRLSLHYEGNLLELIDEINDILGTELKIVKEKR